MDQKIIEKYGDLLFSALQGGYTIDPITLLHPEITIDDAYYISLHTMERRIACGERVVGKKIGVTSKAVQDMLGVHQPDFGFLTNEMELPNGASVKLAEKLIQPRAEGEIAFILGKDLAGPGVTAQAVLEATAFIAPCFEIVDSRIHDWNIKIQDTIADNASCGVYLLGEPRVSPAGMDLAGLKLTMFKNGQQVGEGYGSAVQGNPLAAVAWLANTLGKLGIPFKAGETILSGSLVPLESASIGDEFLLEIENLGTASISFCA